jgi:hypothetical protein
MDEVKTVVMVVEEELDTRNNRGSLHILSSLACSPYPHNSVKVLYIYIRLQ